MYEFAGNTWAASPAAATAPGPATATVTRTTLIDTDQEPGTLGFDVPRTLSAATQGVITALPVPGTVVRRDQPLYAIGLRSARLMYGPVPLSRTLSEGVSDGPDVKELERNLRALGYDPGTIDDHFSAATAEAIDHWQDDHGQTQTGQVAIGDVVFFPGPVRVGAHHAEPGDQVGAGHAIVDTNSTTRIVTVNLPATNVGIARTGDKVTLELPGGGTTPGVIARVGTVASAPAPSTAQANSATAATTTATVPVTIRVVHPAAAGSLDQAPVTVDFTRQLRTNVLAVPVTALVSLAGGGYALDAVEGGTTRRLPVQTGLFSTTGAGTGQVEISGAGIAEGAKVVIPQ